VVYYSEPKTERK